MDRAGQEDGRGQNSEESARSFVEVKDVSDGRTLYGGNL